MYSEAEKAAQFNALCGPILLDGDPLGAGAFDWSVFLQFSEMSSTHRFIKVICKPHPTEECILMRTSKEGTIQIKLARQVLISHLNEMTNENNSYSSCAPALIDYFSDSSHSDWQEAMLNCFLMIKSFPPEWNDEKRISTIMSNHKDELKFSLEGLINTLCLKACYAGTIIIFDAEFQQYSPHICYFGTGQFFPGLAGAAGFVFKYRNFKIATETFFRS